MCRNERLVMRYVLSSLIFVAICAVMASAGLSVLSSWQPWAVIVLAALHGVTSRVGDLFKAISNAEDEREVCASMADHYDFGTPDGRAIAALIRARKA